MLYALFAHMTLLTLAVLRRNGGQGVAAFMLLLNWGLCSGFVYMTDLDFPWTWYATIDWITAIILWIDRGAIWQRILIASYAAELLMHASFAWVTRNYDNLTWSRTDRFLYYTQLHYHDALSAIAWGQMIVVGSWIAYDAVRDWRLNRSRRASVMAGRERAS